MADTRKPEKSEGYYSADAAAARRAAEQERAGMSQADVQNALGRPGEPVNPEPGLTHDQVEQWGTQAEKDEFAKQDEARAEAIRRTPSMGGDDEGKGLGSRLRGVLAKRRKMIIAAALSSSLIGFIIAGFFALLPLKLENYMKNFGQKFGDKIETTTEKRVGQIVTYYLVKRALGYDFANCEGTSGGGRLCDPIVQKGGILADTYRNMQIKKFENNLAEKQNIRFRVYEKDGRRRLAITTPSGTIDDTIGQGPDGGDLGRFDPDRDVFGSNKEARIAFKQAVSKEVPWYRVMKRRHMRALLRDKYGVKQWRIFEKTRDRADDRIDAAKKRLRTTLIDNVTKPALGKTGLYLKCVVDGCTKAELNGDANPRFVEEANATAAEADCKTGSATRSAACRGGLNPDSNGTTQDSDERTAARQELRNGVENAGSGTEMPELDGNATEKEVQKIIQKATVKKLASIGISGIGIAEVISQIDKAIAEDYIGDITESRNKLQFARAFQIYQTGADEWKDGGMTGEEVNALMTQLNGTESSRLFAHDFNLSQPTSSKTCSDGKTLSPSELVCEDRMIRPQPETDLTAYYNSSPALKVMHSIAVAYRATVGKVFSSVGNILNSVTGPLFEKAMEAVPGFAKEAVQDLIDGLMNRFFGVVITGAETGSDLYEIIRGGAKTYYNDVAQFTIGGTILSPQQSAMIDREIAAEKELENSSLTSKIANLDYNKSVASRALAVMPYSFSQATGSTMTAALNPGNWFRRLSLAPSSAAAPATNDPQGIVEKGWPTGDPAITKFLYMSPNNPFWEQCDTFDEEWSRQIAEDPDRKTSVRAEYRDEDGRVVSEVVEGVNPCRLNHVAIESVKAPFTEEDDAGLGAGGDICRPEEAVEEGSINPVVVVGDSIMKGADETGGLKRLVGGEVTVDAKVGRQIKSGSDSGIDAVKTSDQILGAKTIIVGLGTNPGGSVDIDNFKQDAADLIKAIKKRNQQARIYWVGIVSTESSQYGARNNALREVMQAEDAQFIDARDSDIPLSSDDIHPTSNGYKKLARKISNDLPDSTVQSFTPDELTEESDQPQPAPRDDHLDLARIASSNGAHSITVRKLKSKESSTYKGAEAPSAPTSLLDIILIDAVVTSDINLDREIEVTSDILYSGSSSDGVSVGRKVKISDAIYQVAANSSNTHANILMKALGGPSAANSKIRSMEYKGTNIGNYYRASIPGVSNTSTASDVTRAMNKVYSGDKEGFKKAQRGLKNSDVDYGLDSEANKWGKRGSPAVTGNSAIFKKGGSKYIITVYINRADADAAIKTTTEAVLAKLSGNPGVPANSQTGCGDENETAQDIGDITGTRSELNERLIDNPKIKIDGSGIGDINSGRANDNLVKLMIAIMENGKFDLPVNVIQTGHGCPSEHCSGLAVDIGYYSNNKTGQRLYKFLYKNRKELKINQMIFDLPPSGYQCLNAGAPIGCQEYYRDDLPGHNNHIHVSVKP